MDPNHLHLENSMESYLIERMMICIINGITTKRLILCEISVYYFIFKVII
jgi:hypothetical protein